MGGARFDRVILGAVLLFASCGGGSGQTTDGGRGGAGGSGAAGAGGQAAGTGGSGGQATGTGGSGPNCPSVAPCGGDIVGTWKVTQSCVSAVQDLSTAGTGCTGASANSTFVYSGTLTFNTDDTFTSTIAVDDMVHEHFPSGCSPFGYTCAQLMSIARDAGLASNCSLDSAGGCNCDVVSTVTPSNPGGTYSASGTMLTTTETGKTPSMGSFCVQGSTLYLVPTQGDGGATVAGDLVFSKQ